MNAFRSMDELPVKAAAINLITAIPTLAQKRCKSTILDSPTILN
jgi:hypothetical protein